MSENQPFSTWSYQQHERHLQAQAEQQGDPLHRLMEQDSIHGWRHDRMYRSLEPLMAWGGRWLTIGDGIGTDANWLIGQGATAVASDIGDALLQQAQQRGLIQEFRKENAEHIQLPDQSFDFVLCKEAYHHFPRPYLAVYEMLRVCGRAIVLIEPQDPIQQMPLLLFLKNTLQRFAPGMLSRLWKNQYSFETVGNYVYKISEREVEKIAMGMGYRAVAFYGLNDCPLDHPDMNKMPPDPKLFRVVKRQIAWKNWLSRLGIIPYRLLCCVIFKTTPPPQIIQQLETHGYRYIALPPNPYA
jgi:ubiquinone/menaquinone biosynthesis C-methylase UbiE